ncbi:MAG TPA: hypothetical protein VHX39_18340, partial [Acetobacteraceae bacterium]|nr:hypothetical protein [Acetobacteraceae bacterium]
PSGQRSAPKLTVADNGNGSGAAASISGTISTSRVTVYVATFGGQPGSSGWNAVGIRAGNGGMALSVPVGHYFGYASALDANGGTAASPVNYVTVTNGSQAIAYQCLTAAQARIQSLLLPNLDGANVVVRKLPIDRYLGPGQSTGLPAILLTPVTEQMPPAEGVNSKDDVLYGVLCTIVDADNQEPTLTANLPLFTLWRQSIARAFRCQRLNGVASFDGTNPIINASVEPADQLIPAAWTANLYASALLLRFVSREPRGL